jgi:transposase InsO family protein
VPTSAETSVPVDSDREAISWVATTDGINSSDIRDLMIESIGRCFGLISKLPKPIEWLSDNGSPYTAGETRALARDIGLVPCTTPIQSPQSNGMAEAFVKTIKRDYARVSAKPDANSVLRQLDYWFDHYNPASQRPSVYIIEVNRSSWNGCRLAGYLTECRARSTRLRAAEPSRTARLKSQGPSGSGCIA